MKRVYLLVDKHLSQGVILENGGMQIAIKQADFQVQFLHIAHVLHLDFPELSLLKAAQFQLVLQEAPRSVSPAKMVTGMKWPAVPNEDQQEDVEQDHQHQKSN